jgi:pSer/pThr/pTyr-binding forkhead associated (FHA) protein
VCGRSEGELRLAEDATVSPRHARFTAAEGALRVEDLGSLNGTFVRLRAPRRLAVGDELRVGRQLLRIEAGPRLAQLLEGGGTGERFPLAEGTSRLGREEGEVTFPADRYVSGRHARIEVRGEELLLADEGSSNGTFARIAGPVALAAGDEVLIGMQLVRVER